MIKAQRKPLDEIVQMLEPYGKVLIAGCGTCVTICFAGGEREVAELASLLRLHDAKAGRQREYEELTVQRQCEDEFVEAVRERAGEVEAVLSMACGVGSNFVADRLENTPVLSAVNTTFLGPTLAPGVWEERCAGCGNCVIHRTGGICPVARCAKTIMNGPCGGTNDGKCEIRPDVDCAWHLIVERMRRLGRLEELAQFREPKDWSAARDGGPRRIVREDLTEPEATSTAAETETVSGKK
jgi:ferredoxin